MSIIYHETLLSKLRERYLFLFDLDLTLVQTDWPYTLAILNQVIRQCGGHVFPESDLLENFWIGHGLSRNDFIKKVLRLKPSNFWQAYHQLDVPEARVARTIVLPGVEKNLHWLKAKNKLAGVVTAAYPALAQAELALLDFRFDSFVSVSGHAQLRPKPEPDGLLWSMNKLGCAREETIYIGDSYEDYACALAAGVDFIHYQRADFVLSFDQQAQPLLIFDNWEHSPFLRL